MKTRITSAALVVVLAAGPACLLAPETATAQETITGAVQQPLRDLSIVREKTPDALLKAAKGPYDDVDPTNCEAMRQEILALDDALGDDLSDVDLGAKDGNLVTDAVKSAVRLPFSGVVRRLSGAQRREKERDRAIIAGIARRAYLKGAINGCAAPPKVTPPMIIRTEAPPAPPVILKTPSPESKAADLQVAADAEAPPLANPRTVKVAEVQQPAPAGAPRGTLEAQAQDVIGQAPPEAVQRKTVTVATP